MEQCCLWCISEVSQHTLFYQKIWKSHWSYFWNTTKKMKEFESSLLHWFAPKEQIFESEASMKSIQELVWLFAICSKKSGRVYHKLQNLCSGCIFQHNLWFQRENRNSRSISKEESELRALRKKTRKRTRKFEIDGVIVTTTTSKVIYGDDDLNNGYDDQLFRLVDLWTYFSWVYYEILFGLLGLVGREPVCQISKPSSNPSWNGTAHPVCETFNVMRAFKASYTQARRMVREPNTRMCGWDCEPALHHPWMVRISFAANRNLSVFCANTKRTGCAGCPFLALGVLCSPQVHGKSINRAPLMRRMQMVQRVSGALVYTKLKNHYITCMVTGPITSWCGRSVQSASGIKIAVIGMSTLEVTDNSGFINNLAIEVGITRLWDSLE